MPSSAFVNSMLQWETSTTKFGPNLMITPKSIFYSFPMLYLIVKLMSLLPDMQRLGPLFWFKLLIFLRCSLWRKRLSTAVQLNVRYFQRVTFAAHTLPAIKMSSPPLDPLYCGAHTSLAWHHLLMITSLQMRDRGQSDCNHLSKQSNAPQKRNKATSTVKNCLDFWFQGPVKHFWLSIPLLKFTSHQDRMEFLEAILTQPLH